MCAKPALLQVLMVFLAVCYIFVAATVCVEDCGSSGVISWTWRETSTVAHSVIDRLATSSPSCRPSFTSRAAAEKAHGTLHEAVDAEALIYWVYTEKQMKCNNRYVLFKLVPITREHVFGTFITRPVTSSG